MRTVSIYSNKKTTHLHRQVEKYKLNILKLMAKRNFSKFQSLYNQSMIDISLINNNQLKQFYTIPYGTKTVPNENCFNIYK